MNQRLWIGIGMISMCYFAIGCRGPATAADAWNDVLKRCAVSKTWTPKNMVYMGPSNNVGVGAVWREKQDGGFGLIELAPGERAPADIVNIGVEASCHGESAQTFKIGASADLVLSQVAGASAGLAAELNRARKADVSADSWREVQIVEGPFDRWVRSLPQEDGYRRAVKRSDGRIAYRSVEVTGLTATLTFDQGVAAEIHAEYGQSVSTSEIGEIGGTLTIELKDSNQLVIRSSKAMFIQAELARYVEGEGVGRGGFTKVTPVESPTLTFEVRK